MSTGVVWNERYAWHDLGAGAGPLRAGGWIEPGEPHAEHAATKRRIRNLLDASGLLEQLTAIPARLATEAELLRFHTQRYVDQARELSAAEGGMVGLDAWVPRGSYEIALLAAGGTIAAVDAVQRGDVDNAYALVRPIGHHAEADGGKGFCIFGNLVLGALHAREVHGVERIAILDWDVHHGNGAQSAFWDDPSVLTISVHQDGVFPPASGPVDEVGTGAGHGYNINVPLPPGSGGGAYCDVFARVVEPALRAFGPDLLLVASGFDANGFDPMSRQLLGSEDFRTMARAVRELAEELCGGRLVLSHEGGYHTGIVPFCALAVFEELSGIRTEVEDPFHPLVASSPWQALQPHQEAAVDAAVAAAPLLG
jgi:acetoin utilization deacetylase AcuC-like enzyme